MKKIVLTTLALLAAAAMLVNPARAQEKEKEVKTGWSLGILPSVSYNADYGFQYGAFGDVYYYGDGSTYPDPLHKISWEASHFTKGKTRLYLSYDSKYLIPNMRLNASFTFMDDPMFNFWGFNGPASLTDYTMSANKATGINYFGMSRKMLRALMNVQGRIADNLNWAAGINIWNWKMGDMRDSGYKTEGSSEKSYYNKDNTLYRDYIALGAIKENEVNGGWATEMNLGLVYDTRDIEAAPSRGIWAEAYLNGDPFRKYLKACAYFRNYIDIPIHIPAGDPVFAYRLAWQQTIAGETPFYMIQNVPVLVQRNMISEGFGSFNTIRGVRENRILTEGFAWANFELRIKLVSFKLFKQYFYIAVNPFFDAGIVTKAYRPEAFALSTSAPETYLPLNKIYNETKVGDIVYCGGGGLKIAMNQNFIITADVAHCFYKPLDGGLWINIGTNYMF